MDAARDPQFDTFARAPDGFRHPPHSIEIEQRVLGAIMVNNAALVRCRERSLRPEHFYEPSHAGLYEKLRGRIVNGRLADVEALFGISNTTLWECVRTGKSPAPIDLGPNTRAWLADEVDAFLVRRAKERPQQLALSRGAE